MIILVAFVMADRGIGWFLRAGTDKYYGLDQHSEVLMIGHSELMLAVDKASMEQQTGKKISKYCRQGVNIRDRYEMVKHYLSLPVADSLKTIIYGVDPFLFNDVGELSDNSYKLFYPFIGEDNFDSYIHKNAKDQFDYYAHKLICCSRYNDELINCAVRGWLKNWDNMKFGKVNIQRTMTAANAGKVARIKPDSAQIKVFKATINYIVSKGYRVVLLNTPNVFPLIAANGEAYLSIIKMYEDMAQHPQIDFWDFDKEMSKRYNLFFDNIHLNKEGQKVMSEKIADRIKFLR